MQRTSSKVSTVLMSVFLSTGLPFACDSESDADAEPASGEVSGLLESGSPLPLRVRPTVLLVHGAWADALGWQRVIRVLQARDYRVVAVDIPLSSLATDVATVERALSVETAKAPVVVVGHSYGGAVITAAAADKPNVKALVYINAFAPDVGETVGALSSRVNGPLDSAVVPDAFGYLHIDEAKFHDVFCKDVSSSEAALMAATQKPISASAFGDAVEHAAWEKLPAWYLLGTNDRAIPPETQRFMAQRMNAHVTEIASSHVPFASHPLSVVRIIEEAAEIVGDQDSGSHH